MPDDRPDSRTQERRFHVWQPAHFRNLALFGPEATLGYRHLGRRAVWQPQGFVTRRISTASDAGAVEQAYQATLEASDREVVDELARAWSAGQTLEIGRGQL
jgi:hypothetical protein